MKFLRITPLDIYQQEFKRVLRGLDPDEVEDFLERVADDYEQVLRENAALKKQIESLESQLTAGGRIKQRGASRAAIGKDADDTIRDAKKEAENIVRQAMESAETIISKARNEAHQIRSESGRGEREEGEGNREHGIGNREQGELIVQEASAKANELLEKAKMEEMELRREISRLRGRKERFLIEYRELLEKHLNILTAESSEKMGE
jgi:DivIVA domain-containing protein